MKKSGPAVRAVVLFSLLASGPVLAQLTDLDRTSVFRNDVVRIGVVVTLCHIPPGNPSEAQMIEVAEQAVAAHLAHGDSLGACPYECDSGVPAPLAATGQRNCSGQFGAGIDCTGTGQDGEYQYGVSVEPRFTDNGDGTVTDFLTGLIWLRDASCIVPAPWLDALDKANTLADGSCDLTDSSEPGAWRLPNVRELHSLIDYRCDTICHGHPFIGVPTGSSLFYWSSTSSGDGQTAWTVSLGLGSVIPGYAKIQDARVWPVRGPE